MNRKHEKQIRSLLEKGETEDLSRELSLSLYHIENSNNPEKSFTSIISGLKKSIPIPHIIGYTLVDDIPIIIDKYVLHPGPETVILIKKAIEYINRSEVQSVLDLCTGSGAVAVSVAKRCKATVVATDISSQALQIARLNASQNNVAVSFLQGDMFQPVAGRIFKIIISNPPYVKTAAIKSLPHFVRNFAPKITIDGGSDGLLFHKIILSKAKRFLSTHGCLFLECEDGQDIEIIDLCSAFRWEVEDKYPNRYGNIRGFRLVAY